LEKKILGIDGDGAGFDLAEIEDVAIRFKRSVPAPWMVRANSICLGARLPSGFGELLPRIRSS